jgi:hypothetical protein
MWGYTPVVALLVIAVWIIALLVIAQLVQAVLQAPMQGQYYRHKQGK